MNTAKNGKKAASAVLSLSGVAVAVVGYLLLGGDIRDISSLADGLLGSGGEESAPARQTKGSGSVVNESSQASQARVEAPAQHIDFSLFRDGQWVTGVGTVKKVLPDDTIPPCHQRFILSDERGQTVLVAHNIDQAARLAGLRAGDRVAFRGEYRDNDQGGVVHWTHPDSSGRRKGGWLRKE